MDLKQLKVRQEVVIKQHCGVRDFYGSKVGERWVVAEVQNSSILISTKHKTSYWRVWSCTGKGSHHHRHQECSCIFDSVYSWRKL